MKFLQHIQRYLLLNHPIVWSSRIVPVLSISILVNVLLFFFFYSIASAFSYSHENSVWVSFISLCSIITIIVYLIFLLRFNQFKVFGKLKWYDFSFHFLLYFITLSSIIYWPFIPNLASHISASGKYNVDEMVADARESYLIINQLEYTQSTVPYRKVNIVVNDSVDEYVNDYVNNLIVLPSASSIHLPEKYIVLSNNEYSNDTTYYYSLEKQTDVRYIGTEKVDLTCSGYPYLIDSDFNDTIYNSLGTNHNGDAEKKARLNSIFEKYIPDYDGDIYSNYIPSSIDYVEAVDNSESVCSKYKISMMTGSMSKIDSNIMSYSDFEGYGRLWLYMSLYASLLLIIFRFMSPRTFLWTLLFTFLLFVFSVIIIFTTGFDDIGIPAMMLFYYVVFTVAAITILFSKSRNVFQGIALNLSFFFVHLFPFVATIFVTGIYEKYNSSFDIDDNILIPVELIAMLLLIVSSLILHARLFYKWYSLPEE